jgi:hypothetical protein
MRIAAVTFIAGHSVLLMNRLRPTVGSRPDKAVAREPEVALDAGIPDFFTFVGSGSHAENKQAAQEKGADKRAITF